jgi:hypothetical protein
VVIHVLEEHVTFIFRVEMNQDGNELCIQGVSEIHATTLGVCSTHKNNEKSHANMGPWNYGPFYFGRRWIMNKV